MGEHEFMSVNNMIFVLRKVDEEIRLALGDRAMHDLEESVPVKRIVYNIMTNLSSDVDLSGESSDSLTDMAIQATIAYFTQQVTQQEDDGGDGDRETEGDGGRDRYRFEPIATIGSSDAGEPSQLPQTGPSEPNRSQGDDSNFNNSNNFNVNAQTRRPQLPPPRFKKCISIDGQDRDTEISPKRYHFTTNLADPIRSVCELSVETVVVPIHDHAINSPHLFISFDELVGSYDHNASDPVRRAFSKLVPRSTYASTKGRTYVILEPVCDDAKEFYPPVPSLSKLTFRLTRPNGTLVSDSRDDVGICKVVQSSDGNWVVVTRQFWKVSDFAAGDLVRFGGVDTGVVAFDAFMTLEAGHEIIALGMVNALDGCNKFIVRRAGSMNPETGAYDPDPDIARVFDGTNAASSAIGEISVHGSLVNLSAQVSVTMVAKCSNSERHVRVDGAEDVSQGTDRGVYL